MKQYVFNYNGDPKKPPWGETNEFVENFVSVDFLYSKFFVYYIDEMSNIQKDFTYLDEKIVFLLVSTSNSAHSISEIISFLNFYLNYPNYKVAVSEFMQIQLPFLYELLLLFIPFERLVILQKEKLYKIKHLITHRNEHMNYLKAWEVPFTKEGNFMHFQDLTNVRNNFLCNMTLFFNKIENVYRSNKDRYQLYDNIMLIKTSADKFIFSQHRCFEPINERTQEIIASKHVKILSIHDFKDIYEYICVLYHAKNIIVSYGGAACTNRFFCNPESKVILIANLHYKSEYDYKNENGIELYWHLRHSHIFAAKKQFVLLDFPNFINETNVHKILDCLEK